MKKTQSLASFYRRSVQTILTLFFIYVIWNTKYPLNNFLNPKKLFEFDPFVMIITSVANRVFTASIFFAILTLGISLVLGRFFCGWGCPLGSLLDFWRYIILFIRKFVDKKIILNNKYSNKGRNIKYYLLITILIFSIFGIQFVWFFDPITIFVRTFSFNIHPFLTNFIDKIFIFLITRLQSFKIQTTYFWLKESFLSVNIPRFPHTKIIFYFFIFILLLELIKSRFWCKYICPLGAMFAFVSKYSFLERKVFECKKNCSHCAKVCRMDAIKEDNTYVKEECILCMDCITYCPSNRTKFIFLKDKINKKNFRVKEDNLPKISRSSFLSTLIGSIIFLFGFKNKQQNFYFENVIIRPPGALKEKNFVQQCVRCGNCMKVCPTNVLQPCLLENGFYALWTPRLNNNIGYCEYQCNLCGKVCPTNAIKRLSVEEKVITKIGTAQINKKLCIPWRKNENCLVCEEHCPVPTKAIKVIKTIVVNSVMVKFPEVLPEVCIGCGICENKCPSRPFKAIKVFPVN